MYSLSARVNCQWLFMQPCKSLLLPQADTIAPRLRASYNPIPQMFALAVVEKEGILPKA